MHCNIFLHVRHLFLACSFALYRVELICFSALKKQTRKLLGKYICHLKLKGFPRLHNA